jgi:acyl-CoA thioesterase
MPASAFEAETAVVARGNGRYKARLSTAWDIGDNANGGYAMLPVLRALRQESGHADPLSITTHFLRPIQGGGDAEINTSLIRRGRSVSVLSGALTVAETQRLQVSAVFGDIDDNETATEPGEGIDVPAPTIPPPEECVDRVELLQGVALPIASRIDVRVPADSAVAGESNRAITEGWVRLSDGTPPTVLSLPLFADAFPPSLFAKLGSVGWVPTIELTVHVRRRPDDGWVQARFECDDLVGGRMIESGTLWDQAGRVVARSRQLGLLLGT